MSTVHRVQSSTSHALRPVPFSGAPTGTGALAGVDVQTLALSKTVSSVAARCNALPRSRVVGYLFSNDWFNAAAFKMDPNQLRAILADPEKTKQLMLDALLVAAGKSTSTASTAPQGADGQAFSLATLARGDAVPTLLKDTVTPDWELKRQGRTDQQIAQGHEEVKRYERDIRAMVSEVDPKNWTTA